MTRNALESWVLSLASRLMLVAAIASCGGDDDVVPMLAAIACLVRFATRAIRAPQDASSAARAGQCACPISSYNTR